MMNGMAVNNKGRRLLALILALVMLLSLGACGKKAEEPLSETGAEADAAAAEPAAQETAGLSEAPSDKGAELIPLKKQEEESDPDVPEEDGGAEACC